MRKMIGSEKLKNVPKFMELMRCSINSNKDYSEAAIHETLSVAPRTDCGD